MKSKSKLEKTKITVVELSLLNNNQFIKHLKKFVYNSQWVNKDALKLSYDRYNKLKEDNLIKVW